MKKLEFINALGDRLSALPPEEVRPLLDYYMEIVADRMEDGMTEEEAIESLGSIEELAQKALEQQEHLTPPEAPEPPHMEDHAPVPPTQPAPKKRVTSSAIALAIILSPLWLTIFFVVLGLEIAIWATLGALVAAAGAMLAAGIPGAVVAMIPAFDPISLAGRIFVCGGCILTAGLCLVLLPLTVKLLILFAKFHRFLYRKLRGRA